MPARTVIVPQTAPAPARRGDRPTVRQANLHRAALLAMQSLDRAVKLSRPRPWAEYMPHEIIAVGDDVLTCVRVWRGTDRGTQPIFIFRPPRLRASELSRDGVTYVRVDAQTRTASEVGETDETQIVTPVYLVGDIVLAVPIRGRAPVTGVPAVDEQRRALEDANGDGRAYASVA